MKNFKFKSKFGKRLACGAIALVTLVSSSQVMATSGGEASSTDQKVAVEPKSWIKRNPKKFGAAALFTAGVAVCLHLHNKRCEHEREEFRKNYNYLDMFVAIHDGHIGKIKEDLERGVDVNGQIKKKFRRYGNYILTFGTTPLIAAATFGNADVVKFLLANGAEVNMRNEREETALMVAAEHGQTEVVRVLLANGADVNAKDNLGHTALMIAAASASVEIVKMLLAAGADRNAVNDMGETALSYIQRSSRRSAVGGQIEALLTNDHVG